MEAGRRRAPYSQPSGYTGTEPRGGEDGSNGLIIDPRGASCSASTATGAWRAWTRRSTTRSPSSRRWRIGIEGKRLNSPNDAVFRSNGDLYFTDPAYGMEKQWEDPKREIPFAGVYRRTAAGEVTLLTRE